MAHRELTETEVHDLARTVRAIDIKQFDRDVAGVCKVGVQRDMSVLVKLGQRAVPVFWINGRPLDGAQPIETLRAVIDEERAKAKADRAQGGKPTDYYERVIKNGATGP